MRSVVSQFEIGGGLTPPRPVPISWYAKRQAWDVSMPECAATLIWVHRSMRPQKGTFEHPPATIPELSLSQHPTLTDAISHAVMNKVQMATSDRLAWIHAWRAGGAAIFDEVEIEAIRHTIQAHFPGFP